MRLTLGQQSVLDILEALEAETGLDVSEFLVCSPGDVPPGAVVHRRLMLDSGEQVLIVSHDATSSGT